MGNSRRLVGIRSYILSFTFIKLVVLHEDACKQHDSPRYLWVNSLYLTLETTSQLGLCFLLINKFGMNIEIIYLGLLAQFSRLLSV